LCRIIRHLGSGIQQAAERKNGRFVLVQQVVAKLAETAINYPPMQEPATFNLDAVKRQITAMMKQHEGE
jgi:hypothetical protein